MSYNSCISRMEGGGDRDAADRGILYMRLPSKTRQSSSRKPAYAEQAQCMSHVATVVADTAVVDMAGFAEGVSRASLRGRTAKGANKG